VSSSSISWTICKYAPRPRQTTTPAPHRPPLSFNRPDALRVAEPTASKHWKQWKNNIKRIQHNYKYYSTLTLHIYLADNTAVGHGLHIDTIALKVRWSGVITRGPAACIISKWWVLCIPRDIYWRCNCINDMFWTYIFFKKGYSNQKGGSRGVQGV